MPPSNVQLCGNKRLVIGFSDEAFAALKTVSESDHPSIDVHCLSKNLLDHQIVTSDLKAHPLEQSFPDPHPSKVTDMRNQYGHCVLRVQLALNLLKIYLSKSST